MAERIAHSLINYESYTRTIRPQLEKLWAFFLNGVEEDNF